MVCKQEGKEARFDEFTLGVRHLYKQAQKVDKTVVLEPIEVGGKRIFEAGEIPFDHTDLGEWIQKGGGKVFEMKTARKNRDQEAEEDTYVSPEVYFTLALSSDVDPMKIVDRISCEWGKIGGIRLYVKEISSFNTNTAFCLYHVRNDGTKQTIEEEVKKMLDVAQSYAIQKDVGFEYRLEDIPDIGTRVAIPKVDGMDTRQFQGWNGRQQALQKVIHVEVDSEHVAMPI